MGLLIIVILFRIYFSLFVFFLCYAMMMVFIFCSLILSGSISHPRLPDLYNNSRIIIVYIYDSITGYIVVAGIFNGRNSSGSGRIRELNV